jgi:hypothetical protein
LVFTNKIVICESVCVGGKLLIKEKMAKIIFVLVFSVVLTMPFRIVYGQGGLQDLLGGGDLTQTFDEAKKALGAATGGAGAAAGGEAAFNDYFGGSSNEGEADAGAASLSDWIDTEK